MKTTVVFLALLGLAVALPRREKRQTMGCISSFQNVPNLCVNNANGQVFFAHPTDPTKFLQCDINNRMYIIQCPANEVFNVGTSACQPASTAQVIPPRPFTNAPPTTTVPPPTVKHNTPGLVIQHTPSLLGQQTPVFPMQTTAPSFPVLNPTATYNPCTPNNIALGKLYFAFPGDKSRFYECDMKGNPKILSCPPLLQWDQTILSCMYPMNPNQQTGSGTMPQMKPTPQIPSGQTTNPCTATAIAAGRFFFPHPDQTKYIQCDMWGDAFTNSCPSKLVWNAYLETCYSPFFNGRK